MIDFLAAYTEKGDFFLSADADLASLVKDVPEKPGVFCIYRHARGKVELVFLGYTHFRGSLRKTLTQQPGSGDAAAFLRSKMQKEGIDAVQIHWFVSQRKNKIDDPETLFLELMKSHKQMLGGFPHWQQY
ncbi:MAG: hypothetical protein Q8J69_04005 [Sphingobacteriaceae bacterium]|nr:hypothetical protein [Sphingobacteriaceae bacterium]